jgi:pimeloyl-ACP methyl ester carboxylesterase
VKLHCEKHPDLSKQNILFIHGNLASTTWWKPTLVEWKKRGGLGTGSLIFADWRGCGKNPAQAADQIFTIEDLARDYLSLLNGLDVHDVAVVGHSLGGLIALQMMALEPRRISRAALLDSVGVKGVIFDDSMYDAFRQMALNRELTETVILGTVLNHDHLDHNLKTQMVDDAFKAVGGIGSSVLEILKTVNLVDAVAKIKVPTLILHGQKDQVIPLKDSEYLAELMPNGRLEILPESGHCWNVEDPAAFVQRLRAWF